MQIRRLFALLLLGSSLCVLFGWSTASGATPSAPPDGVRVVKAGKLPVQCTESDAPYNTSGATYGAYWSNRSDAWISAPYCYARWGLMQASPSRIISAGDTVTVTAIPDDGSLAGYVAVQGGMTWTYPGRLVSGCGSKDMTCTVKIGDKKNPPEEWTWYEFSVSGPGRVFILPPSYAPRCQPDNPCLDTYTNAWSYVGVAPGCEVKKSTAALTRELAQPTARKLKVCQVERTISGRVTETECNVVGPSFDPAKDCQTVGVKGAVVRAQRSNLKAKSDRTSTDGTYSIAGNKKGRYTVTAEQGNAKFRPAARRVTIQGSDVSGVDFTKRGARLAVVTIKNKKMVTSNKMLEKGATIRFCNRDKFPHRPASVSVGNEFQIGTVIEPFGAGQCRDIIAKNNSGDVSLIEVYDPLHAQESLLLYVLP